MTKDHIKTNKTKTQCRWLYLFLIGWKNNFSRRTDDSII